MGKKIRSEEREEKNRFVPIGDLESEMRLQLLDPENGGKKKKTQHKREKGLELQGGKAQGRSRGTGPS